MVKAMQVGRSAMEASQEAMNTIAHNISNSETNGFKRTEARFEELFSQQLGAPGAPTEERAGSNPMDVGDGVALGAATKEFSQGTIEPTSNPTDMAIEGEGFFVVGNADGSDLRYTRVGEFEVSPDNEIVTKNGDYVFGWNGDLQDGVDTNGDPEPLTVDVGAIGDPEMTSDVSIDGNFNSSEEIGTMHSFQSPSFDELGNRHDIDFDFVKTDVGEYAFSSIPEGSAQTSDNITNITMERSEGVIPQLQRGEYEISTEDVGGDEVEVTVTSPEGDEVLTQTITDVNQTVTLNDGDNDWFTIDYVGGEAPSDASFTVGEAGTVEFDGSGNLTNVEGYDGGDPQINFDPEETDQAMSINLDLDELTSVSTDTDVDVSNYNGNGAASIVDFSLTDGGGIQGEFNDGTNADIGQVAMANFANPSGLVSEGSGEYSVSPNSGEAEIGSPNQGGLGNIVAQALEGSNVDMASELIDMMGVQRMFQSNTQVIQMGDELVQTVINMR